jgi:hypothetical protein
MQALIVYLKPKDIGILEEKIESTIISNFERLYVNYTIDSLHHGNLKYLKEHEPKNYISTNFFGFERDLKDAVFLIIFNESDNPTKDHYSEIGTFINSCSKDTTFNCPEFLKRTPIKPNFSSIPLPPIPIPNEDGVIITYATKKQWKKYNKAWKKQFEKDQVPLLSDE